MANDEADMATRQEPRVPFDAEPMDADDITLNQALNEQ